MSAINRVKEARAALARTHADIGEAIAAIRLAAFAAEAIRDELKAIEKAEGPEKAREVRDGWLGEIEALMKAYEATKAAVQSKLGKAAT